MDPTRPSENPTEPSGDDFPCDFIEYLTVKLGQDRDQVRVCLGHWLTHHARSSPGLRKTEPPPRSGTQPSGGEVADLELEPRQTG